MAWLWKYAESTPMNDTIRGEHREIKAPVRCTVQLPTEYQAEVDKVIGAYYLIKEVMIFFVFHFFLMFFFI